MYYTVDIYITWFISSLLSYEKLLSVLYRSSVNCSLLRLWESVILFYSCSGFLCNMEQSLNKSFRKSYQCRTRNYVQLLLENSRTGHNCVRSPFSLPCPEVGHINVNEPGPWVPDRAWLGTNCNPACETS